MAILSFVEGIIILVVVVAVSFIALSMQKRTHEIMQAQQQAWERAQEMRQLQWRMQQEARIAHLEQTLAALTQERPSGAGEHPHEEGQAQEIPANPVPNAEEVARTARIAYEIARLPRVEDIPLPLNANDPNYKPFSHWQPPALQGADLANHDLTSRYLRHADLRNANLSGATLFMADLSWACLAEADLSHADLSASNLSHADLRNANLSGANLLVTDLNDAHLAGARFTHARNLTADQIRVAHYDSTTQLDEHIVSMLSSSAKSAQPQDAPAVPAPAISQESEAPVQGAPSISAGPAEPPPATSSSPPLSTTSAAAYSHEHAPGSEQPQEQPLGVAPAQPAPDEREQAEPEANYSLPSSAGEQLAEASTDTRAEPADGEETASGTQVQTDDSLPSPEEAASSTEEDSFHEQKAVQ